MKGGGRSVICVTHTRLPAPIPHTHTINHTHTRNTTQSTHKARPGHGECGGRDSHTRTSTHPAHSQQRHPPHSTQPNTLKTMPNTRPIIHYTPYQVTAWAARGQPCPGCSEAAPSPGQKGPPPGRQPEEVGWVTGAGAGTPCLHPPPPTPAGSGVGACEGECAPHPAREGRAGVGVRGKGVFREGRVKGAFVIGQQR